MVKVMTNTTQCLRQNVDIELINNAKEALCHMGERLEKDANTFSLLGSAVRLKILYLFLKFDRMCVCDLSDVLEMKQSPISQHLRKLKDAGLLENRREGLTIFYSIPSDKKEQLKKIIENNI